MDNSLSLTIGGEVKAVGLGVSGKLFVFTPSQQNFLLNLQKMKNVLAAALSVDRSEEWGQSFLKSRKFRKYLSLKLKAFSDRNGMDVDWWYQFGKWLTDGYREKFFTDCAKCGFKSEMDEYEVETFRNDELELHVTCPACYEPVESIKAREEFKPSREQVEGWKELGQRLIPKVDRVQHTFENSEIVFQNEGD